MKYNVIAILAITLLLSGCSVSEHIPSFEEQEEIVTTEPEPVITADEFLKSASAKYKDEIGATVAGVRIVEKLQNSENLEYSVYIFDDMGFTHEYYWFTFNPDTFEVNQTTRLDGFDYDSKSLTVDEENQMVNFDLGYVEVGSNTYEYFRDMILSDFDDQAIDGVAPGYLVKDTYMYSIVGDLAEYVVPLPELDQDEEGYILCDNSDENWTYISDGNNNAIITGYESEQYGTKLVIPAEINGKHVYAVRHLDPVESITCVEVSEGIEELQGSFTNWSNLNRLILHDGLLCIVDKAIDGTAITDIDLPESITLLEDGFFSKFNINTASDFKYSMTRLTGVYQGSSIMSIIIPGTVKTICEDAFKNCDLLATVFIEDGCETIENHAFYDLKSLQAVAIPRSVSYIDDEVFGSNVLLVVKEDSYAENYAISHGLLYSLQ